MRINPIIVSALMAGCAQSSTSIGSPLPRNLTECLKPKPPTGAAYDSTALALGNAITRVYERKVKHDFVVKQW